MLRFRRYLSFFSPLNLYFKTETITEKPGRNELILPVMLKQRKKEL